MDESNNDSILMLFDSIIEDGIEKRIIKLIIDDKTPEEVIKQLLNVKAEEGKIWSSMIMKSLGMKAIR